MAMKIVDLKDFERRSPMSAGMTRSAEIRRIPTALMEMTMVTALSMMKSLSMSFVLLFRTSAMS